MPDDRDADKVPDMQLKANVKQKTDYNWQQKKKPDGLLENTLGIRTLKPLSLP